MNTLRHKGCGGIITTTILASMPPQYAERCLTCGKSRSYRPEVKTIEVDLDERVDLEESEQ